MENNSKATGPVNKIVISSILSLVYCLVMIIYNAMPLSMISNFLLVLFIVSTLVLSSAAIYFAVKNYRRTKILSIIFIIMNSIGLLIPLILLLLLM
ncbi:Uncharacterised protein [Chryseobacterium indologenes]|nr:Uncharacterised protein [Chryseobacterium indologenes]